MSALRNLHADKGDEMFFNELEVGHAFRLLPDRAIYIKLDRELRMLEARNGRERICASPLATVELVDGFSVPQYESFHAHTRLEIQRLAALRQPNQRTQGS